MNFTKIVVGVITGAVFTVISLAISFYLFQKNSSGSGFLGSESNFAFLGAIFGILYGSVVGVISGLVITGAQLNLPKAILFGLVSNLILGFGLAVVIWGADWNAKLIYFFLVPAIVGGANAIIVSLISSSGK